MLENSRCELCDGEGYQRFELFCPTVEFARTVARPCACYAAPAAQRISNPLRPPEWARGPDSGVWLAQSYAAILSKPCNCAECKRAQRR
jgi:hypothetical protein